MKRLVITSMMISEDEHIVFAEFDENRNLLSLQIVDEDKTLVDRIYIGRVERVQKNIGAAFVRCTTELHGYLPLEQAGHAIYTHKLGNGQEPVQGDELLVQVVKDPIKTKLPVLTASLSIKGNCTVMETGKCGIGVSRKLAPATAHALKEKAEKLFGSEAGAELIIRTNAAELPSELVDKDILQQKTLLEEILHAIHKTAYTLLYSPQKAYIQRLKGMAYNELLEIVTDLPEVHEDIRMNFGDTIPADKIRLYDDPRYPLATLYSLQTTMKRLTQKQVWLDSGANIIIEQLETLTFIDVNSSRTNRQKSHAILQINMEAAREIARQIRLRNLSGMILIDFINMPQEEEEQLISYLKEQIAQDPIHTQFMDMTKLGLVELTRKKVHKSLHEIL